MADCQLYYLGLSHMLFRSGIRFVDNTKACVFASALFFNCYVRYYWASVFSLRSIYQKRTSHYLESQTFVSPCVFSLVSCLRTLKR